MLTRNYVRLFIVFVSMLIVSTTGCSNTESSNVTTEGLKAEITATATGNGSTGINVDLSVGSGGIFRTGVELTSGDTLTATDGSSTKTLVKDNNLLGDIEYETSFSTDAENTQFTVSMLRSNNDNAENSVVTMPAPYTLTTVPAAVSGSGSATTALTWTNYDQNDTMTLDVICDCSKTVNGQTSDYYYTHTLNVIDDGTESFSMRTLTHEDDPSVFDRGCDIDITMKRTRTGTLDPAYGEGGYIRGVQARAKSISYTP